MSSRSARTAELGLVSEDKTKAGTPHLLLGHWLAGDGSTGPLGLAIKCDLLTLLGTTDCNGLQMFVFSTDPQDFSLSLWTSALAGTYASLGEISTHLSTLAKT